MFFNKYRNNYLFLKYLIYSKYKMGNTEPKIKEILPLIESSIKKGNVNIISFALKLISNIKKIKSKNDFKKLVEEKLSNKEIYFIRHAESLHNVLEVKYRYEEMSKWNVLDPKLTEKGIGQTNKTIQKIKESGINFQSVFVSPLSRTMQTFFLIEKVLNKDAEIIITDFAREIFVGLDKNRGKKLSLLKEENKNTKLNFEYMTKEYWWYDSGKEKDDDEDEGYERFQLRLCLFALWITFRPEKYILIVSHSHVFIGMQNSYGIHNADMVKMNNKDLLSIINNLMEFKG